MSRPFLWASCRALSFALIAAALVTVPTHTLAAIAQKEEKAKLIHLPFEKAEVEVLSRFRQDLSKIGKQVDKLAVYQVSATGKLPADYSLSLKQKIEEIILASKQVQLIDCSHCQVSRLVKDEEGNLRYEAFSEEPGRPQKIASELGVNYLLFVDLNFTQSEVALRVKLIRASNQEVAWTNEYTTTGILADRERLAAREYGIEQVQGGDSVSHIIIGEIAFSVVLSPGIALLPTISQGGYGGSSAFYPSIDFLIGEKYDNGHKRFGFLFGAILKAAEDTEYDKHLPWALRIAPQFRYTFNPYNTSFARISVLTEVGGFISSSLATAYFSVGPELMMVKRFSLALMPMYVLPTTMKSTKVSIEDETGGIRTETYNTADRFGGFGVLLKGSLNW